MLTIEFDLSDGIQSICSLSSVMMESHCSIKNSKLL